MARTCIMCGKKLSILGDSIPIGKGMELCVKCNRQIETKYIVPMNRSENLDTLNNAFQESVNEINNENFTNAEKEALKEFILTRKEKNEKRIGQETEKKIKEEKDQKEQQERQKIIDQLNQTRKNFKVTTGYNFEGYKIVEYKKVVSGSVVLGTGFLSEFNAGVSDFLGAKSNKFADKIDTAKDAAYDKMVEKAMDADANAIIGIDFDYITFENNMIGVVVNGTAVVIEILKEQ